MEAKQEGGTLYEKLERRLDAVEKRLTDIDLAAENFGGRPMIVIQHMSLDELTILEAQGRTHQTKDMR